MDKSLLLLFVSLLVFDSIVAAPISKSGGGNLVAESSCLSNDLIPYRAKGNLISVWNGEDYTDLFIKGTNLGVAVPGTQPGELAASREQYQNWFERIKEIGYNTIRTYTLHYPRFYEELAGYNISHPQSPLLLFQGIWLDESVDPNLYNQTVSFDLGIQEVINCVHGNETILHRFGRAYGTYTADISQWVIGYIIGREVYPYEISETNLANASVSSFVGDFFSITDCSPAEAWICGRMDEVVTYENEQYATQRPVSFSSWPTLDPITHPTEVTRPDSEEDDESVDLSKVDGTNADAGFFVSYHAYPYYPDFISDDPGYITYSDEYGPNSYLGYLNDLKSHYENIPLIVGEFGVPTSWGSAHSAHSEMHHGSIPEELQGVYTIRMLENLEAAGLGGGMQFSWIDEWFKQAWITNPLSDAARRHVWHNVMNPEQNFGVIEFVPEQKVKTSIGSFGTGLPVSEIKASADMAYFNIGLLMNTGDYLNEDFWIAIDTYDQTVGESILPGGTNLTVDGSTMRAEFALNFSLADTIAYLYVTKAYDTYGIKQMNRLDTIVSTITDGADWNLVKWIVNYSSGEFQNTGILDITPNSESAHFDTGISWNSDSVTIRIPWTLINYADPSQKEVTYYTSQMTNNEIEVLTRYKISDGIALTVVGGEQKSQSSRFSWDNWDVADIVNNPMVEQEKKSVPYIEDNIGKFNSSPIPDCDTYVVAVNDYLNIDAEEGLLINDIDFDGDVLEVLYDSEGVALQGTLDVYADGAFLYTPYSTATGTDQFVYSVTDGEHYSREVTVTIEIDDSNVGIPDDELLAEDMVKVYPNPSKGIYTINLHNNQQIASARIYNTTGQVIRQFNRLESNSTIDITDQKPGVYILDMKTDNTSVSMRLVKL